MNFARLLEIFDITETRLTNSKSFLRKDIVRKTEEYLSRGGEITKHHAGESAERGDVPREKPAFVRNEASATKTYLKDLVAAIDDRKGKTKTLPNVQLRRPKKKIIYDDFGEPLREVWTEN